MILLFLLCGWRKTLYQCNALFQYQDVTRPVLRTLWPGWPYYGVFA